MLYFDSTLNQPTSLNSTKTLNKRIVNLTPPIVTQEHIKEKIICVRGHRERIFQVYMQHTNEKVIFHNYGQGGAGWTFLFGCVNTSIRQFEEYIASNPQTKNKPITVIGAGCYGLLSAILLARKQQAVQIIAKELEHIPSNKAAGFFFPRARKSSMPEERAIFTATGMESYTTYLDIMRGAHPFIKQGPKLLTAYYGMTIDPEFNSYIEQGLIEKPKQVIVDFGNNKRYDMMEYKTIFMNTAVIMQELWQQIQFLRIPIIKNEIESFDEVADPIIFNCTGFGAKKLTEDKRIVPVQGHLITLQHQPPMEELQYMVNAKVTMLNAQGMPRDELIYYAPKENGILGITFLRGQDGLNTNQHEFDRLIQRSKDFFGT